MSTSNTGTTPEAISGRWAISGTGLSNAILLDTATGETWHADAGGFWVRMVRAEEFSGALDLRAFPVQKYTTKRDLPIDSRELQP